MTAVLAAANGAHFGVISALSYSVERLGRRNVCGACGGMSAARFSFGVGFCGTVLRMRGARFPELYFVCLAAAGDLAREGVGVSVSAHGLCARTKGSEKIKLKFDFKKFFFKKPKNELEGSENGGEAKEQAEQGAIPEKLAEKCEKCGQIVLADDFAAHFGVCPKCGHYRKIDARARISMCFDEFNELFADEESGNVLDFPGYTEKLAKLRAATGEKDGVVSGYGKIGGIECAVFSMDYRFMMGSMGHTVGEKIAKTFEYAIEKRLPVVGFVLSGGARMQEGIISLMQMAKTSAAVAKHGETGLLYISVLTDPTTGGVSASFAFEADIIIAEKGALIGFAGPRVIEQTIRQKLPEGFQRAEFIEEKGFADLIVERKEMKEKLSELLALHCAEANA